MAVISKNKKDSLQERCKAGAFPRRIEIELASTCNLRCVYCPRKYLKQIDGLLSYPLFTKIIDEAKAYPETILVLHRRGESLLHPDFIKMCGYVKDRFKEVQLATNATLLDEARSKAIIEALDFISFSIDIPGVFDRTRVPAKYCEVEGNILRFLELNKGKVRTQVSMVKTIDTPDENVDTFKRIWQGKVDRVRIYEEHSRDGRFGSLARRRPNRVPCVMPFYELLVFSDGKVGRCNHDWNGAPLGDLNTETISGIWSKPAYDDLRRQQETLSIRDDVCKDCDSWYPQIGQQCTGETIKYEV